MMNDIPEAVVEYVRGVMDLYDDAGDGPCDNMRIMRADGPGAEYEHRRAQGCCGYVDYQSFVFEGVEYLYGFNYGH